MDVKGTPLDPYGRALTTAVMTGDGWRTRHDAIKWTIYDLVHGCQVPICCEVLGLFTTCIPQASQFHRQSVRKRQSIVPDFMIRAVPPRDDKLEELKCIGYTKTHHTAVTIQQRCGAVKLRGQQLGPEHRAKARTTDRTYNHTPQGTVGPVETRLKSYGAIGALVIGPRAEISKDLDHLITMASKIGGERLWRSMGSRSQREARAVLKTSMRRRIGVVAARENARLKRERLAILLSPDGGAAAAGRRRASRAYYTFRQEQYFQHWHRYDN